MIGNKIDIKIIIYEEKLGFKDIVLLSSEHKLGFNNLYYKINDILESKSFENDVEQKK